ncbi:MAG: DUF814 domain-containing protein [Candidatus Eisenbacteria bacterium]|nr:DUF814 domain-containing protein [Candidatus Eisenbacteria bacterium]
MNAPTLHILAAALDRRLARSPVLADLFLPAPRRAILRFEGQSMDAGDADLHLDLDPQLPGIWLDRPRAHPNPDPLAEVLKDRVLGRSLEGLAAGGRQRRVVVSLTGRPGMESPPARLEMRLFPPTPRLIIRSGDDAEPLSYPGSETDRAIAGGDAGGPWIFDDDLEDALPGAARRLVTAAGAAPSRDAVQTLSHAVTGCDYTLAEEIFHRAGSGGTTPLAAIAGLREEHDGALAETPARLHLYLRREGAGTGGLDPPAILSSVILRHLAAAGWRHSQEEALEQARRWAQVTQKAKALDLIQRLRRDEVRRLKRSWTRLAKKLVQESRRGDEAALWRTWAQALLVHAQEIAKGRPEARVPDPMDPSRMLAIPLDTARTAPENAEIYFRKAGREERARPLREKRLRFVEALVAHLAAGEELETPRAWRQWIERGDRIAPSETAPPPDPLADLKRKWQRLRDKLLALLETPRGPDPMEDLRRRLLPAARSGAPASSHPSRRERSATGPRRGKPSGPGFHPRRFRLSDNWLVLVGRSNRENDLLTHRHAKSNDLWFHAQGAAGSHVVLRRGDRQDNPGKRAIEEAAAIAARYSKAQHSSKVAVIYTPKKYVRKPRKAPAGLAVCTQMKTVFVRPADEALLKKLQIAGGEDSGASPGTR